MWYPVSIKMMNFMSHEDSYMEFRRGKAVLIYGLNTSNSGQKSNGSGKSAIAEAISVGFTGKVTPMKAAKTVKSDMVRDGAKELSVIMKLAHTSGDIMEIDRTIFRSKNKPSLSYLVVNKAGESIEVEGIEQVNERIIAEIGISISDIYDYYLMNGRRVSFYDASDAKKKELIGRFTGGDAVLDAFPVIAERVATIQTEAVALDRKISKEEGKIVAYDEQLSSTKTIDELRDSAKKSILEQVAADEVAAKALLARIDEGRAYLKKSKTAIEAKKLMAEKASELVDSLTKRSKVDSNADKRVEMREFIDGLLSVKSEDEGKSEQIQTLLDGVSDEVLGLKELLAEIKAEVAGAIECPSCKHEFVLGKDVDIPESNKMIDEIEGKLKDMAAYMDVRRKAMKEINASVIKLGTKIAASEMKLKEFDKAKLAVMDELRKAKVSASDAEAAVELIESNRKKASAGIARFMTEHTEVLSSIDNKDKRLAEVDERSFETSKPALVTAKAASVKQLSALEVERSKVSDSISDVSVWEERMKAFYTELANESLDTIEVSVNEYLMRMKSDMSIKLDGFKLTQANTVSDKISTRVFRDGEDSGSFHKHSEGEKARIDLSTIMTVQDIINGSCHSGGLDLMFMDEVLTAVESYGLGLVMESLSGVERTILNITHVSPDEVQFDESVYVINDGVSAIKDNIEYF